jgi:ABC-type arginine transport system ATPase subunit
LAKSGIEMVGISIESFGMMIGTCAGVGAVAAAPEGEAAETPEAAHVVPVDELVGQALEVLQSISVWPAAHILPLAVSGSAQQDAAMLPPVEVVPFIVAQHLPKVADAVLAPETSAVTSKVAKINFFIGVNFD